DAEAVSLFGPSFGYRTVNALYFVGGKYYIELVGSSESEELFNAISQVAKNVQNDLAPTGTEIPQFSYFPRQGLIAETIKLYISDGFGFGDWTDVFTGQYKINEEVVTVFFSDCGDDRTAKTVAENYYNFSIGSGGTEKESKQLPGKIIDIFGATEIVFAAGRFVAGVHEADNEAAAIKAAIMLKDNLTKAPVK
ncbi:unnamed protein product, partial [marine sediment metagenome]